jgi:hypothetical protein
VVEVGTYLGAAMAVMSKFNSKIEIHAFDLFDQGKYDSEHHQLLEQALGPGKSRTMEHVAEFLTAYSNIHLHQVTVDEYVEFDHAIDVFVEDSSHCNPQLRRSLDTWMPGIRSGGLALIHDYRPWRDSGDLDRFPDVESEVERLAADSEWDFLGQLNNVDLGEFGSYAVFQKL